MAKRDIYDLKIDVDDDMVERLPSIFEEMSVNHKPSKSDITYNGPADGIRYNESEKSVKTSSGKDDEELTFVEKMVLWIVFGVVVFLIYHIVSH